MALVNVETGGPVITGVDKSSRWYRRSPEDTLPDLFLDWERSGLIETVWSPKTGIVHAPYVSLAFGRSPTAVVHLHIIFDLTFRLIGELGKLGCLRPSMRSS